LAGFIFNKVRFQNRYTHRKTFYLHLHISSAYIYVYHVSCGLQMCTRYLHGFRIALPPSACLYKSKLVYYAYNIIFSSQISLWCRGTQRRTVVAAAVAFFTHPRYSFTIIVIYYAIVYIYIYIYTSV